MSKEEQWRTIFHKHFSPSLGSKYNQFYSDVTCTLSGIKPALLVDHMIPNPTKLQKFLQDIHRLWKSCDHSTRSCDNNIKKSCGSKTCCEGDHKYCILSIEGDVLFINLTSLYSWTCRSLTRVYVDITKGLNKPEVLKDPAAISILEESFYEVIMKLGISEVGGRSGHIPIVKYQDINNLSGVGRGDGGSGESGGGGGGCITSNTRSLNMCSLFGYLLCYPVVYWFDVVKEYDLNMEPLVHHALRAWRGERGPFNRGDTIFSFTVPECVLVEEDKDVVKECISTWYSHVRTLASTEGYHVEMQTKTIALATIAL